MDEENALIVFEDKKIRRVWYHGKWYFSVVDVVGLLTDSHDSKQYIKKLRKRDYELGVNWGTICTPIEMIAQDGKMRKLSCANTEGIFRIIQSIPSKKAEPFKRWLAKVGYERVQEIENPELAQERMKKLYRAKGYSDEWIEKRVRGIAVRQELAEEWRQRGVSEGIEFGILTNEISKATFGKTVEEYKQFKGLKKHNLRDHMDGIELILTILGEATTTRLTDNRDSQKFPELQIDARDGGDVAGSTRKDIESKLGQSVISDDNYLEVPEKVKRLKK